MIEAVAGRELVWRVGRWLYLGSRRELLNNPRWNGEYALQTWLLADRTSCVKGSVFIDVGANIGDWTKNLLDRLREHASSQVVIHAFEPAPAQRQILQSRLETGENFLQIDPRAVGADVGKSRFYITGDSTGTSGLRPDTRASEVEIDVTTLDQVAKECGYNHISLIKVDTEGNDFNVIRGAKGLFDQSKIGILQFEYNWRWIEFGFYLKDVFLFLQGRPYCLGKLTRDGVELYDTWHPELDRFIETNYVVLHRDWLGAVPHKTVRFNTSNVPECA